MIDGYERFGIRCNGDDHTENMLDAVHAMIVERDWLSLPGGEGHIKMSAPLFVAGESRWFEGGRIEGAFASTANGFCGTVIDHSAIPNVFGCGIQNVRDFTLKNMIFLGPNRLPPPKIPTNDQTKYLLPGISKRQYSPQCGIAIDPCVGEVPPDGGYPGITYRPDHTGSSRVTLENVFSFWQNVGIIVSPGLSLQGDGIRLNGFVASECDIAVATCQPQIRGMELRGCNLGSSRIGISGVDYGRKQGAPPIIFGGQAGPLNKLFRLSASFGVFRIYAMRMEAIMRLGDWGLGASGSVFPAYLDIEAQMENDDWPIGDYILSAFAPVKISGFIGRSNSTEERNKYRFYGESRYFHLDPTTRVGDKRSTLILGEGTEDRMWWHNEGNWENAPVGRM